MKFETIFREIRDWYIFIMPALEDMLTLIGIFYLAIKVYPYLAKFIRCLIKKLKAVIPRLDAWFQKVVQMFKKWITLAWEKAIELAVKLYPCILRFAKYLILIVINIPL